MASPITLDSLLTLDAIARRNSFAAAAEELHRVPSAVSYTVQKLEEDLGVALFDRSRRRAELTATGRLVLEQGRHILKAADELTALARQAAEGWEPELRICIDSILTNEHVLQLLADFQQIQPKTEIRLSEEVLGGSWDALNDDRCDLVIGAEGKPPAAGFRTHALGEVVFDFAVAAGHPLTHAPQPLTPDVIQGYPTVVVADSSQRLPRRSSGLLDGRSRITVPTIDYKVDVQIKGLGVGFLPRHRIQQELTEGCLVALELESPRPNTPISVAWRAGKEGKALAWFIDRFKSSLFDPKHGLKQQ
ncbi:LysR family transcriptional regulator [Aliidiomarina taiwanensis]|uniref:LysR family transcriptional regulator n=1 Tax=Aliidiomarina taiwanensis TaxID=946228 RepID=A0A432X9Q2_9GAMM|nr:LysR family transcriptional regulator [Aliidiomarina taiwanensis]RUO44128.1 LysR family transcriptional regulator [Aliidiomarina taiwanensis]